MSEAEKAPSARRAPSPDSKGVFVPMTRERLALVDADRQVLGLSRGAAMARIYDEFRTEGLERTQQRAEAGGAVAEQARGLADRVHDLASALKGLDDAWSARARQRQSIGVHSNQIAKLANVHGVTVRQGGSVCDEEIAVLGLAVRGVERALDAQQEAELDDDELRARTREALHKVQELLA
ncbi:hypothetical protein [Brachybacterium sp. NPDC056505]|jgi:hypothetical protein|uniref:hypothetical protein n=1 Tax=Brachybacterium sp. NPDC056505 TaxID=3345843 RepID=UPI00366CF711